MAASVLPSEGTGRLVHELLWPAGGLQSLESHAEVVMLDFAASLLAELERWMLTANPAMVDLNTFCDTSDKFVAPTSVVEEVQRRLHIDEVCLAHCRPCMLPRPVQQRRGPRPHACAQEAQRKRRYGRLQKAMGDISLLAGSPSDAADHYATALELARTCSDAIWAGAALKGIACAKARSAAASMSLAVAPAFPASAFDAPHSRGMCRALPPFPPSMRHQGDSVQACWRRCWMPASPAAR